MRDRPFSRFLFRLYASDLSEAIYDLSREVMGATKLFDTRHISRQELIKALDDGDKAAGTTERQTSWDGQIMKVDWVQSAAQEEQSMPITGQPGIFSSVLDQIKRRRAQTEAKFAAIGTKAASTFDELDATADAAEKELDAALHELAQHTNGGPT